MNSKSLSIIITTLCFLELAQVLCERRKRIMFGHQAGDSTRDYYKTFRYFVHLVREIPIWKNIPIHDVINPPGDRLTCGGSLIAPFIVQTAAHCIADKRAPEPAVDSDGRLLNYNLTYFDVKNEFEWTLYSFIGNNLITSNSNWHRPHTYKILGAMRRIEGTTMPIMLDQGYIILQETVTGRSPTAQISYAPVYRNDELVDYHYKATEKESTCLLVGHGNFFLQDVDPDADTYRFDPSVSNPFRWGWRTMMNILNCEYVTFKSIYRHMQYDYDNEATWACLQTYEHLLIQEDIRYGFGGGDSGGPVVCGGHYIGVAAGAANPEHRGEKISLFTPHVEMLWENGFNQRRDMIAEYDRIRQNLERRKLRPPFDKKLNADVFDEPLLQASPRILDNVSLIITTMLVRLLL